MTEAAWWTDAAGKRRRVQIMAKRQGTATIEYFDNSRRQTIVRHGRRYSAATRVRQDVLLRDLRVA